MSTRIEIEDDHEVFKAWCLAHKKPIMHRMWIGTQVFGLCKECMRELNEAVGTRMPEEDFDSEEE